MAGHTLIGLKINSHRPEVGVAWKKHESNGPVFTNEPAGVIAISRAQFSAVAGQRNCTRARTTGAPGPCNGPSVSPIAKSAEPKCLQRSKLALRYACSSEQARNRCAASSGVMSRCGIPSISKPTMNFRTVAERSSGG